MARPMQWYFVYHINSNRPLAADSVIDPQQLDHRIDVDLNHPPKVLDNDTLQSAEIAQF